MSDQRPEIQRYEIETEGCDGWCGGRAILRESLPHELEEPDEDQVVRYPDHLRHLKLSQIAVLDEMNKNLTYKSLGNAITDKLIELRKELEG